MFSFLPGYKCEADFYEDIYEDGADFYLGPGPDGPTYGHWAKDLTQRIMSDGQTANNRFSSGRIHCWSLA